MQVSVLVAIWTYACAYLKTGGDLKVILTGVSACFGACGHVDLRLCMFERRRRYGVTFLHIAAPAVIWTYVYVYASVAGGGAGANVAVARVACILDAPRREMQAAADLCSARVLCTFCAKVLKSSRNTDCLRMRRSRCRAVGGITGGSAPSTPGPPEGINVVSHA